MLDDNVAAGLAHLEWLEADPDRVRSLMHCSIIATALQQAPAEFAS
jgi:hypothetical protein